MKILMRGDCTSRRSVFFNQDLFPNSTVIQNEKSPIVLFLDHAKGIDVDKDSLLSFVDLDRMPPTQKRFFLGQFERTVLTQEKADLLVMDSYADMNFELWEANDRPGKFWVNRSYMKDMASFVKKYHSVGKRSFQQSVEDAVAFIALIRARYGNIPVMFLNQQVEVYPKLHNRLEFYDLGSSVAKLVDNCEFGGVLQREQLELADIGSSGPGLTLHYSGSTYRKMLDKISFLKKFAVISTGSGEASEGNEGKPTRPVSVEVQGSTRKKLPPVVDSNPNPLEISFLVEGHEPKYKKEQIFSGFYKYFIIPSDDNYEPRVIPAVIELSDARDFPAWVKATKKAVGDNAFRSEKKALQRGYFAEMFDRSTFISDIYDINTSMPIRNGVPMRDNYRKTVEEMGGYPSVARPPKIGSNEFYWTTMFGAFKEEKGHSQGELITDKRLCGYITVRRIGDMIFYPQLLGHGANLEDGIMAMIHFHIMKWIVDPDNKYTAGVKAIMYTNADVPNEGLRTWKKRAGFKPRRISLVLY
ncbi:hypothetical protein [Bordetella trematum]|uniref:hypothetical protein n=1 Tax=Bordetella trematum TaxID=123899 RepID=UPI001404730B|nr:hypothetical protein [Bordetella trematum]QIM70233.1 hypothetical protein EYB34_02000 [Bordetella trematum]